MMRMSGSFDNERLRKLLLSYPAKAIEILYDTCYNNLLKLSTELTHNREVAEDIVQETFMHVWQNHKKLGQHHEQSIYHYLLRVVRNKSITHYTRQLNQQNKHDQFLYLTTLFTNDPSVESQIIRTELNAEIRDVIATFPRREKECMLFKLDEELTTEQIAERLKVSKKAVERSITSANKRLRKYWLSRK